MDDPLVVIDVSRIHEGRLDEVRAGFRDLAEFVRANEPRAIAYEVFIDEGEESVTVLQVHPDAASMEVHMELAGPRFRPFADLLTLSRIDVFGAPSDKLLGQLRRKADMLGGAPLSVHALHTGFARLMAQEDVAGELGTTPAEG